MTDEELIKDWDDYVESMGSISGEAEHMAQQMRDRIEKLVKERDEADARALRYKSERNGLARKISEAQKLDTASFEAEQKIVNQRGEINMLQARAEAAEAKLAKAVEGLRFYAEQEDYEEQLIVRDCGCCSYLEDPIVLDDKGKLARAALAELEKTE